MASDSIITLNVGGQIFQTTIHTLTKYPESMLAAMFNHSENGLSPMPKTQEGHYFLDADPDFFKIVLNWLRFDIITTNDTNTYTGVISLADYLGLDELKNDIQKRKRIAISQNDQKLKQKSDQLSQLVQNTKSIQIRQTEIYNMLLRR